MKHSLLASLVGAVALMFTSTAMAADAPVAPAGNIVVVNIQQIMRDSTAAQSVREQMESKQKAFQNELSKKEEALQKEDQELGKKRSVLSKTAFEEQAGKFRTKATDLQKEVQSKKTLLDNAFEHALNEIQKSVTDIIADMAKEKSFILALPTSQVLFADTKLDISSEVLNRLNQKLPKLEVKFDAPASSDKAADKAADKTTGSKAE